MTQLLQNSQPRTSLVLPVFNGAQTLGRALNSVAIQTQLLDEVVIVDDGSTDTTAEVIANWKTQLPIIVVKNPRNIGVTASLQLGVASTTGSLIFRLDADDEWLPNHVATLMQLRNQFPDAALYASRALKINTGSKECLHSAVVTDEDIRARLLWDNPLVHSAIAFDKEAYISVRGYAPSGIDAYNRHVQDYILWIRLLKKWQFAGSDVESVVHYMTCTSVSRIDKSLALMCRLHIQREALNAFAFKHPLAAVRIWPIVLIRQIINKMALQ